MTDLYLADVSEFQTVNWPVYGAANPAVIVRADNGYGRADYKWADNAAGASTYCKWWAAYQYLPKTADPVVAAKHFMSVLGSYRPDVLILDLEEGDGDQSARMQAWHNAIQWPVEWDYSGVYFSRSHNLAGQIEWIAAYQSTEPTDKHLLWQYTDKRAFSGVSTACDGSVFHGTIDDLIALTTKAQALSTITPAPTEADLPLNDADKAWISSAISAQVPAIAQAVWTRFGIHTPDGKVIDLQTTLGNILAVTTPSAVEAAVNEALKTLPAAASGSVDVNAVAKAVADALAARLAS